jgi:hypothetical protein
LDFSWFLAPETWSSFAVTVVGGLIVAWLAPEVVRRVTNRARTRAAAQAGSEVLAELRRLLAEGGPLEVGLAEALLRAAARKHGVQFQRMPSVSDLVDDLIKEIMDSDFLPTSAKLDHVQKLEQLRAEWRKAYIAVAQAVPRQPRTRLGSVLVFVLTVAGGYWLANQWGVHGGLALVLALLVGLAVLVVLAAVVFVLVSNLSKTATPLPEISFAVDLASHQMYVVAASNNADWSEIVAQGPVPGPVCQVQLNEGPHQSLPGPVAPTSQPVKAGDTLMVLAPHGAGEVTLSLVHRPSNSLLGQMTFSF